MRTFGTGDTLSRVQTGAMSILRTAKVVLSGLAVIYMVYLGITMVLAMGEDGDLTNAKRQIYFAILAFLFINIPGQIYSVFGEKPVGTISLTTASSFSANAPTGSENIFFNSRTWDRSVNSGVVTFIKIALVGIMVFQFTFAGIRLMSSRGDPEVTKKAKGHLLYGVLGLIGISLIDPWVRVVYASDFAAGQGLFAQMANLMLFFAGPVIVFYLSLGGYYYIIAAGKEDMAKKAKSILINTFVGVIILLASYTFLKDLQTLSF